jgi:hypothetical protein
VAGYKIHNDDRKKDEYIDGNKRHVKYATGTQQNNPLETSWQKKI